MRLHLLIRDASRNGGCDGGNADNDLASGEALGMVLVTWARGLNNGDEGNRISRSWDVVTKKP